MNPLDLPFGKKPRKEPEEKIPQFIGVRNEAVRDDLEAERFVTITVLGVKGATSGEYRLKWEAGSNLGRYFSRLKMKNVALRASVRNQDRLEDGRLRMNYIPEPGSRISVGPAKVSSAVGLQRSNHNAESVARRMGGGAREVHFPLRGR